MPKDGVFDQYEMLCQFLAAAGVPAAVRRKRSRLHTTRARTNT